MSHVPHGCYPRSNRTRHVPPWMSHVTRTNEACHTYENVTWHIWVSHVSHLCDSCDTWMSVCVRETLMNDNQCCPRSNRTRHQLRTPPRSLAILSVCAAASQTPVWHDPFIRVTWLVHMRDVTHSFVWHAWFICVTWLIHVCNMNDSYVCHVTHSYVWHDSFIYVMWLIHTCDMTRSYVWRYSFIRVTWLMLAS